MGAKWYRAVTIGLVYLSVTLVLSCTNRSSLTSSTGGATFTLDVDGTSYTAGTTTSVGLVSANFTATATTATLTNSGTSSMTVSAASFSGTDAADFSFGTSPVGSVAAASSGTFTIRFAPTTDGAKTATLSITANGVAYNFTITGHTVWGTKFVDGNASTGINKSTAKSASYPKLLSFNSKLYATWIEVGSATYQIRVAVFNGNDTSPTWTFVDGNGTSGLNFNTSRDGYQPKLISFNSKLYLFWSEDNGSANQIRVKVYNGNDSAPSWTFVDGGGATGLNKDTTQGAYYPCPVVFNSKLYFTWHEVAPVSFRYQVRAAVYGGDDSSPTWTFIDGNGTTGLNHDTSRDGTYPRLVAFNSKVYLMWTEYNGAGTQIRASVYNGNDSSPSWTAIDGNGASGINWNTTRNAQQPIPFVANSKLYATWQEDNLAGVENVRIVVFNGNDSSPAWTFVDGNTSSGINQNFTKNAYNPHPIVHKSKVYLTWYEFNGVAQEVRVKMYNGNDSSPSWSFLDGGGASGLNFNSALTTWNANGTVFNDHMYITWEENNGSGIYQIRVHASNY